MTGPPVKEWKEFLFFLKEDQNLEFQSSINMEALALVVHGRNIHWLWKVHRRGRGSKKLKLILVEGHRLEENVKKASKRHKSRAGLIFSSHAFRKRYGTTTINLVNGAIDVNGGDLIRDKPKDHWYGNQTYQVHQGQERQEVQLGHRGTPTSTPTASTRPLLKRRIQQIRPDSEKWIRLLKN